MDKEPTNQRMQELGKRLIEEREGSEKTLTRAALHAGVSPKMIKNFENGVTAPSLPQLELFALLYRTPIHTLIDLGDRVTQDPKIEEAKIPAFISLRNRMIAAILKQARLEKKLTMKDVAGKTGITVTTLRKYETARLPVPRTVLEKMTSDLGISIDTLFSTLTQTPAAKVEETQDSATREQEPSVSVETSGQSTFAALPSDLQDFVENPANLPYLELAKKLSTIDAAKLRTIAEGLLEITL